MSEDASDCTYRHNACRWLLDRNLDRGRASSPCLHFRDRTLTYHDLFDWVTTAAGQFLHAGLAKGSRVALFLPDRPETVVATLALMRIGAVPAPLNVQLAKKDYEKIVDDCRPDAWVVRPEKLPLLEELGGGELPEGPVWIVGVDVPAGRAEPFPAPEESASAPVRNDVTSESDPAIIQYTSGSTGDPKGVVHLHRGLRAARYGIPTRLNITGDDLLFSAAKLYFGYGFGNSVLFPFDTGAASVLHQGGAEPYEIFRILQEHEPSVFFAVPSVYASLLSVPDCGERFDLSDLRYCVSGGEHLSASLFAEWKETFGLEILNAFGATETLHAVLSTEPGRIEPGATGTAFPCCEPKLVGEDGDPTEVEDIGRFRVKSPYNADRYLNRPEETRRTMPGRWVDTGDLMYRDAEGRYHYVGRSDEVIKVRGQKVLPSEIEECLEAHESVREAAAVGTPNSRGIVQIKAFVRPVEEVEHDEEARRDLRRALTQHARNSLATHKCPRSIEIVEELPRTAIGKTARFKLRERL